MPIYSYECSYCNYNFDEFRKDYNNSGKSWCPKCGNISFKLPSLTQPIVFKPRKFVDGTKTPDNIRTFEQERKFNEKNHIIYDKPTGKEKRHRREERDTRRNTAIEDAFVKANDKVNQGFRIQEEK